MKKKSSEKKKIVPLAFLKTKEVLLPFEGIKEVNFQRSFCVASILDSYLEYLQKKENGFNLVLITQKHETTFFPSENEVFEYGTFCEIENINNIKALINEEEVKKNKKKKDLFSVINNIEKKNGNNKVKLIIKALYPIKIKKIIYSLIKEDGTLEEIDFNQIDIKKHKIVVHGEIEEIVRNFDLNDELKLEIEVLNKAIAKYKTYVQTTIIEFSKEIPLDLFVYKLANLIFDKEDEFENILKVLYETPVNILKIFTEKIYKLIINIDLNRQVEERTKEAQKKAYLNYKRDILNDTENNMSSKIIEKLKKIFAKKKDFMSTNSKNRVNYLFEILERITASHHEYELYLRILQKILDLPYGEYQKINSNIEEVRKKLDATHFGLNDIKELILDYIQEINKTKSDFIRPLLLIGDPGLGKTSIAQTISDVLGKGFSLFISNLHMEDLIGSNQVFSGSKQGIFADRLIESGCSNPIILIDELDKMPLDNRSPRGFLNTILDKNQTPEDAFLGVSFDGLKPIYIITANNSEAFREILSPLINRCFCIKLEDYSMNEKFIIAKEYILKKLFSVWGNEIKITDEELKKIIYKYASLESGCRSLAKILEFMVRRGIRKSFKEIDEKFLSQEFPNQRPRFLLKVSEEAKIGYVLALAVSEGFLGSILEINVFETNKKTKKKSGYMKETMLESFDIATKTALKILEDLFETIHLQNDELKKILKEAKDDLERKIEGMVVNVSDTASKDGPSAGGAFCIAILSYFLDLPFPAKIAMTGAIEINGRLSMIGGLRSKLIGASFHELKKVYIPEENDFDFFRINSSDIPNLKVFMIKNIKEILQKEWGFFFNQ